MRVLRRTVIAFGVIYFFWSLVASKYLTTLLIQHLTLDRIILQSPIFVTLIASSIALLIAVAGTLTNYKFVRITVIAGIILDSLGIIVVGYDLFAWAWLVPHLVILTLITLHKNGRRAYLIGVIVLLFALIGPCSAYLLDKRGEHSTVLYMGKIYLVEGMNGTLCFERMISGEYTIRQTASAWAFFKGESPSIPQLVVEGYKGYNVIAYGGRYYAILQSEGEFSIERVERGEYSKVYIGDTVEEVTKLIDRG